MRFRFTGSDPIKLHLSDPPLKTRRRELVKGDGRYELQPDDKEEFNIFDQRHESWTLHRAHLQDALKSRPSELSWDGVAI
jgi:hypothetical protein